MSGAERVGFGKGNLTRSVDTTLGVTMTTLKKFDRFPHAGVRRDLIRLKEGLEKIGLSEFGSSGEGELTVRVRTVTAYARKYKQENGWRLAIYKARDDIPVTYPETAEAVIEEIRAFNT